MSTRIAAQQQKKQQILEAAAACFAEHGFHQTSMQDICQRAQMSPGILYRYYRSKDDLIVALIEDDRASTIEVIQALAQQEDFVQALKQHIDAVLENSQNRSEIILHVEVMAEMVRNPHIAETVLQSERMIVAAFAQALQHAQHQKSIDEQLDPHATAAALLAFIDGLFFWKGLSLQRPTEEQSVSVQHIHLFIDRVLQVSHTEGLHE